LLDTNVVSETVSPKPNSNVISWIKEQSREQIAMSIVTLVELLEGIESTSDQEKQARLRSWLDETVLFMFGGDALPLTSAVLVDWLRLNHALARKQITRQAPDLLLASTARVHRLTIVTRNSRDFANTGITVYNPWTSETHRMETP
jgi:predicted nucleic acid-binding protein